MERFISVKNNEETIASRIKSSSKLRVSNKRRVYDAKFKINAGGVLLRKNRVFANSNLTWIYDPHGNQLQPMWLPLQIVIVRQLFFLYLLLIILLVIIFGMYMYVFA